MSTTPSYAEHTRQQYEITVRETARRLRESVDAFEKRALRIDPAIGRDDDEFPRTIAAGRAINELNWGIANAHLDTMIKDAGMADFATQGEER